MNFPEMFNVNFEEALELNDMQFGLWLDNHFFVKNINLSESELKVAIETHGISYALILHHINKRVLSDDFMDFFLTQAGNATCNYGYIHCLNDQNLSHFIERLIKKDSFFYREFSKALISACVYSDLGLPVLTNLIKVVQRQLEVRWLADPNDECKELEPLSHVELAEFWILWQHFHLNDVSLKNLVCYIEACTGVKYEMADANTLITYKGVHADYNGAGI